MHTMCRVGLDGVGACTRAKRDFYQAGDRYSLMVWRMGFSQCLHREPKEQAFKGESVRETRDMGK